MLALASMFGSRNITNALDLLDSSRSNNFKAQRWKKNNIESSSLSETDTVVIEFVASSSQRKIFQVYYFNLILNIGTTIFIYNTILILKHVNNILP